jgi:hypothetical protein
VGVPGETGQIILRNVIPEIVKKQKRIEVLGVAETEGAAQMHTCTFDGGFRFDHATHGAKRHEISYRWAISGISVPARITPTACFEQEPSAPFGFIDPDFDQAGAGNVPVLLADAMGFAQTSSKSSTVLAQFSEHVFWFDVRSVVIQYTLGASDVADGPERSAPHLSDALGDWIGHRVKLVGLFVQE